MDLWKMLEEKKLNKFNMYLYMFSYTLILMNTMLGQIKLISGILSNLSDISIILLIFKCVIQSQKYKKRTVMLIFLTLTVVILSYIKSNENALIKLVLLIVASYGIEFEKIVKYDIKLKTILMVIVVTAYNLGLTTIFIKYREDRNN